MSFLMSAQAQTVSIPDAGLDIAIRAALQKPLAEKTYSRGRDGTVIATVGECGRFRGDAAHRSNRRTLLLRQNRSRR